MEPLHPRSVGDALPPPVVTAAPPVDRTTMMPATTASTVVSWAPSVAATDVPASQVRSEPVAIRAMTPWRVGGAFAMVAAFGGIGWQVQRLVADHPWSNPLMWFSMATAAAALLCVLVWTWVATVNARRLVGPATNRRLPDPRTAVAMWALPFGFVGLGVAIVAYLGAQVDTTTDDQVSAIPLVVAVIALLLAIPLTYRPLYYLAGVVRQVGGHSARLARWMWVPVVLGLVGVASLVAIRFGVGDLDTAASGDELWGPLWAVAVVAIVPCVIVVALAWRASGTVEETITIAADRQLHRQTPVRPSPPVGSARSDAGARRTPAMVRGDAIRLVPGADLLRLCIVTLVAGIALLSVVGAAVMFMFWLENNDGGLTLGQQNRAWDALGALHVAARVVAFALLAVTAMWSFVVVLNARKASGRRRNPLLAAAAWPAAAVGVWAIADRMIIDQSIGRVLAGFVAQAVVLMVPFLLLERSADAVGARRTPIRITYTLALVLLIHMEGLGGVSTIDQTVATSELGRLTGYLALGALVQLMSTMAVTEACRSISRAAEHEVEHHNMVVAQRQPRDRVIPPEAMVSS